MRLKITNYNKFARGILLLILSFMFFILLSKSAFSHEEIKYKTVYVSSGDSIWNIAKEEIRNNSYYKNKSTKEVIYNIQNINNLTTSNIYAGQKLLIPIN